jgi:hypothetical protein
MLGKLGKRGETTIHICIGKLKPLSLTLDNWSPFHDTTFKNNVYAYPSCMPAPSLVLKFAMDIFIHDLQKANKNED